MENMKDNMKRTRDFNELEEGLAKNKSSKEIPNPFNYNINPYSLNMCGAKGSTLLYNSIKNNIHKNGGYYQKVEYLVEVMGADINKGKGNKSPLYKAIFEGNLHTDFVKIAKFLIEKGARNDYFKDMTPLHLAAISCFIPVLEAFAENGYDFTLNAGPARDVTVINLILSSKSSDINLQKALAIIPVEQLPVIWSKTVVDSVDLSLNQKKIIDYFIESNKLTPLSEVAKLKEKDTYNSSNLPPDYNFIYENLEEDALEFFGVGAKVGAFENVLMGEWGEQT